MAKSAVILYLQKFCTYRIPFVSLDDLYMRMLLNCNN
jgi:hypothetical protein